MTYSAQTFSVGQVLTAAQMQQIETNIRDHQHGVSGVSGIITMGTPQATTSGTTVDFTIPAGAKEIKVNFAGASTNSTSAWLIQIGDAGGIESSGYISTGGNSGGSSASTAGFILAQANIAASTYHGAALLSLESSSANTWVCTSMLTPSNQASVFSAGSKSLSQELTTVRVTTVSGDTFDAGEINVQYTL